MSADDVVLKRTETVLLAELSGIAAGYGPQDIGPVITPPYEELCRRLAACGMTPSGPGLAYCEDAPDAGEFPDGQRGGGGSGSGQGAGGRQGGGEAIVVHAGFVIAPEALAKAAPGTAVDGTSRTPTPVPVLGFDVVTLPGLDLAATVVHRGPMSRIMPTAQNLAHWIDANGYRSAGYARELSLECPEDQEKWVTEIQEPVVGRGSDRPA